MKFLILILLSIQLFNFINCENFINLTIYNNLDFKIVITDFNYLGNCNKCDLITLEPCQTTNIFVSTWIMFKDINLHLKVYRYHYGKSNSIENLLLKYSIYSAFDLFPSLLECKDEYSKSKQSLIIEKNLEEDESNLCLDRFLDISDSIEKANCKV